MKPYIVENVWEKIDPHIRDEVVGFWERHRALPPGEDPKRRADQVVFVARNEKQDIVAVCTAVKIYVKNLRNHFYYYRTMSAPGIRLQGTGMELLLKTRDFFELRFKEEQVKTCKGILIEVENAAVAEKFREAIWPRTKFVFIGYSLRGLPLRVYYFEGAKI